MGKLNRSCEVFREELGVQIDWIKGVRGNMSQGLRNLANTVDTRLIQNDQRNETQEGATEGLFAALRNLTVKIERTPRTTNK